MTQTIDLEQALSLLTPKINILIVKFECTVTDVKEKPATSIKPVFTGPALRGGMGYALKHISCVSKDPFWRTETKFCPESCSCAYRDIFFNPAPPNLPKPLHGIKYRPNAFSLYAPWILPAELVSGMPFSFSMTFYGSAIQEVHSVIHALHFLGRERLWQKNAFSFQYNLDQVKRITPTGDEIIWKPGIRFSNVKIKGFPLDQYIEKASFLYNADNIVINFVSPVFLTRQYENHQKKTNKTKQKDRVDIETLSDFEESFLASRAVAVLEQIGMTWCDLDSLGAKPELLFEKSNPPLVLFQHEDYEHWRYSEQENTKQPLRGIYGTIAFKSPRHETIRTLVATSHIGIGQHRTSGFGRFILSRMDGMP